MNAYFYKLWLPLQLLSLAAAIRHLFSDAPFEPLLIFTVWFLIGPVGIGVGFHRLLSHRQFQSARPIEMVLSLLGTLSGYSPPIFWCTSHVFHHKYSDTPRDLSSPVQCGFWESFLWWRMREQALDKVDLFGYCSRKLFKDPFIKFLNRNFFKIFWMNVLLFIAVEIWLFPGKGLLVNAFLIPVQLEHLRINVISSLSHMNLPLNYRNFETNDDSQNNLLLGWLTMGFAWHNNHHKHERACSLRVRWWEIDIEGVVANLLKSNSSTDKKP